MANYRSDGIGCGGIIIVGLLTLLLTIWNYDLNPFSNEIRAHYKEEICKEMKIGFNLWTSSIPISLPNIG